MITYEDLCQAFDKEFDQIRSDFEKMKEDMAHFIKNPINGLDADTFERMWCGWIEDIIGQEPFLGIMWDKLLREWALKFPDEDIRHYSKCCFERLKKVENPDYVVPDYGKSQLEDTFTDEELFNYNEGEYKDMKMARALLEEAGEVFDSDNIDWEHVRNLEIASIQRAIENGDELWDPFFFVPSDVGIRDFDKLRNKKTESSDDLPF